MKRSSGFIILALLILLVSSCGSNPVNERSSAPVADTTKTRPPGTSEITCPECGFKKVETMPTDVCQLSYTCGRCGTVLHPREGDCCVFCTYGDRKCPSQQ